MIAAPQLELDNYLHEFSAFEKAAGSTQPPWLRELRANAFARFCEVGFPTLRTEDWRFTNISAISRAKFSLAADRSSQLTADQLQTFQMPEAVCRLVFVNGHFAPKLSSVASIPGLEVSSLAAQLKTNPAALEPHLGRYLNTERDAFAALNTAFLADGAFIHVRKGVAIEQPIYLLFVSAGNQAEEMNHPRNLIVAEPGSQVAVIEDYVSLDSARGLCNSATELFAGENSNVSHYYIEREHAHAFNISTLRTQQARHANVASHSVLIGGALVRNNVHPVMAGEGADCLINGLFIGRGHQHLDNYMLVEHASAHCSSRQFYNGILDDHAHGVFHGRIIVHKDAQKTDAKQTNRNLLLSDNAQIDTKPQLEIFADDVKCTHGATIGQIEENALFYLRSRGIDESSARQMLLLAFASECLDRMKEDAARTFIAKLIHDHVSQMELSAASRKQNAAAESIAQAG